MTLNRCLFLLPVLLLNIITTTVQSNEIPSASSSGFPDGQGLVALRLVSNTPAIDPAIGFANQWGVIKLEHSDGTSAQLLPEPDASGGRSTQIFSGHLPQGKYRIVRLLGAKTAPGQSVSIKEQSLSFEVQAQQVTNLGTLIYQPIGARETTFVRYSTRDDVQRFIQKKYSGQLQQSAAKPALGWLEGEQATQNKVQSPSTIVISNSAAVGLIGTITVGVMQAISDQAGETAAIVEWHGLTSPETRLKLAKQSTYALNNIQEIASGDVVAGSNLGQVILYHPERGWRSLDIGDPREITAISATNPDNLLIGGEEGLMLSSIDGGRSWKTMPPPLPNGLIMHIGRHARETIVLTLHQNELIVHGKMDEASAEWQELKRIEIKNVPFLLNWPSLQGLAAIDSGAGKYLLMIPGGQVHSMDLKSREWKSQPGPGGARDIRNMGAERIYTSQVSRASHAYTTDSGATWTPYKNTCAGIFTWAMSFAAVSMDDMYMLCFNTGAFVSSSTLHKTSDGGENWNELVKMPVMATQMYATSKAVFYIDLTGNVYVSRDKGNTWSKIKRFTQ